MSKDEAPDWLTDTTEAPAIRWRRPVRALAAMAGVALAISIMFSTVQGAVNIPAGTIVEMLASRVPLLGHWVDVHWTEAQAAVILDIRLPRVLLSCLVGASLSVAGATYQGLFRNPLADPYLIGVASGAGLGAVIALALPLPASLYGFGIVQWLAFGGAVVVVSVVYSLARVGRGTPITTLLLAGVALGAFANAMMSSLIYTRQDKLHTAYSWLLGGLSLGNWQQVLMVLPYTLVGFAAIYAYARPLNVLQLDEEQAAHLGVDVERAKLVLVASATLVTAAVVSVSGLIGFVGLIVPHAVRLVWGPDYRLLLPMSALIGGIFLIWADALARTAMAPVELPVGVVTALCGAPFFLYLLRQRKRMVF